MNVNFSSQTPSFALLSNSNNSLKKLDERLNLLNELLKGGCQDETDQQIDQLIEDLTKQSSYLLKNPITAFQAFFENYIKVFQSPYLFENAQFYEKLWRGLSIQLELLLIKCVAENGNCYLFQDINKHLPDLQISEFKEQPLLCYWELNRIIEIPMLIKKSDSFTFIRSLFDFIKGEESGFAKLKDAFYSLESRGFNEEILYLSWLKVRLEPDARFNEIKYFLTKIKNHFPDSNLAIIEELFHLINQGPDNLQDAAFNEFLPLIETGDWDVRRRAIFLFSILEKNDNLSKSIRRGATDRLKILKLQETDLEVYKSFPNRSEESHKASQSPFNKYKSFIKNSYLQQAFIQRLLGKALPLEECFINLEIVKDEEPKNKESASVDGSKESIAIQDLFTKPSKVVQGNVRTLILGKAGAGKSVICQYASYMWAKGKFGKEFDWIFWISLSHWNAHPEFSLLKLLYQECFASQGMDEKQFHQFCEEEIHSSKILLLLDGKDELSHSIDLEKQLNSLPCDVLITSRPYNTFGLNASSRYEITDFTVANMKQYLKHTMSSEDAEAIFQLMLSNSSVLGIAHNPINLEMISYLYSQKKSLDGHLTMTQLYQSIELFFYRRYLEKQGGNVTYLSDVTILKKCQDLIDFFSRIAFQGMDRETLILPSSLIKEIIQPFQEKNPLFLKEVIEVGLIKATQEGKLEIAKDYQFLHPTYQELYAARYLRQVLSNKNKQEISKFMRKFKYDPKMQIVFWFTAGLIQKEPELLQLFFTSFLEEPRDLVGLYESQLLIRLLEEAGLPKEGIIDEAWKGLKPLLNKIPSYETKALMPFFKLSPNFAKQEVVPRLLSALKDENKLVRRDAAGAIGNLGIKDKQIVEALEKAKNDEYWAVKSNAAEALVKLATHDNKLVDSKKTETPVGLGKSGEKNEKDVDIHLSNSLDEDIGVRSNAVGELGNLEVTDKKVIDALLKALEDKHNLVVRNAIEALGKLGVKDEEVVNALLKVMQDKNNASRSFAAKTLGKLKVKDDEVIIKALLISLQDDDDDLRMHTVETLGILGDKSDKTIHALLKSLLDKDERVRRNAAEAMGNLGIKADKIIEALLKALQDNDNQVKSNAAEALGKLGDINDKVIAALLNILLLDERTSQMGAIKALKQLDLSVNQLLSQVSILEKLSTHHFLEACSQNFSKLLGLLSCNAHLCKKFIPCIKDLALKEQCALFEQGNELIFFSKRGKESYVMNSKFKSQLNSYTSLESKKCNIQ